VYRSGLREGAEPVPDETKVAELHWATAPSEIGAQVSGDTLAAWAALGAALEARLNPGD
jgi:hypothetical protein